MFVERTIYLGLFMQQRLAYNNLVLFTAITLTKSNIQETVIVKGDPEQAEFSIPLIMKATVAADTKHITGPSL